MSAFNYAKTAQTALRLIGRFGQAGQLHRPVFSGPEHNPVEEDPLLFPAKFVITEFDQREIDGTRVLATDKKGLVAAAGLAVEPKLSDLLVEADGNKYRIAAVATLKPASTPVLYTLQVRR